MRLMIAAVTMLLAGVVLMPQAAQAGFYSGNDLLQSCQVARDDKAYFEKNYECMAYVTGAVDAFNTTREAAGLKSCLPKNVTMGRLRDVTVDYMGDHPDLLDKSASNLVFAATRAKWPCKPEKKSKARAAARKRK